YCRSVRSAQCRSGRRGLPVLLCPHVPYRLLLLLSAAAAFGALRLLLLLRRAALGALRLLLLLRRAALGALRLLLLLRRAALGALRLLLLLRRAALRALRLLLLLRRAALGALRRPAALGPLLPLIGSPALHARLLLLTLSLLIFACWSLTCRRFTSALTCSARR